MYQALDTPLREIRYDAKVEGLCGPHFALADKQERRSLRPGLFFQMIFEGDLKAIPSKRSICWRCADSSSLGEFLGLGRPVAVPDQPSMSRTRRRLLASVLDKVFLLVLGIVAARGLLRGSPV
ncbi:MAG: transposase [Myxococcota bacterium]